MPSTLDDLEGFINRGWKIFPVFKIENGSCACRFGPDCDSPGKHPMSHRGVKDATDDPVRILRWFNYMPGCNWAVATGKTSGVWVLDIDVHKSNGVDSLRSWLDSNRVTLPETLTVATGGGGWHYYFDARHDNPRDQIGVFDGVDVRSEGHYVLLPGSNHISGGMYSIFRDAPVALAPSVLRRHLQSVVPTAIPKGGSGRAVSVDLGRFLTEGFTPGNRDNECYHLACSLWRKYWDQPEIVENAIADCWRATSQEGSPFPWKQAQQKIAQAYKFIKGRIEAGDDAEEFVRRFGGAS